MTAYTPAQLESLNRAIVEHSFGRTITRENGMWMEERTDMGGDKGKYCIDIPKYTTDLNAIVEVVESYCDNNAECTTLMYEEGNYWSALVGTNIGEANNPPLALCIAFAQAAGLDWEKAV